MPLLPPGQIPAPLPPWARVLLQLLPFLPAAQQSLLDYIAELFDSDSPEASTWVHAAITWEHVGNIDPSDRWVHSFDIVNITGGGIDNSWTQDDINDVNARLGAFVQAYAAHVPSTVRCKDIRLYQRYFNPIVPPEDRGPDWKDDPFGPSGPPIAVYAIGTLGTGVGSPIPTQCAVSVTEKTAYPRHWGRTYLPSPIASKVLGTGYFDTAFVNAVADAAETLYQGLADAELFPVVPVVQVEKQPFRGLLTVNQIQVDNIPDVIRRRRLKNTTLRAVRP